jgi:hypothetical protein
MADIQRSHRPHPVDSLPQDRPGTNLIKLFSSLLILQFWAIVFHLVKYLRVRLEPTRVEPLHLSWTFYGSVLPYRNKLCLPVTENEVCRH